MNKKFRYKILNNSNKNQKNYTSKNYKTTYNWRNNFNN